MYIDVNVGEGRTGRIKVREGDDLQQLSRTFARTFQLDREAAMQLEEVLQEAYDAHAHGSASLPLAASNLPTRSPLSGLGPSMRQASPRAPDDGWEAEAGDEAAKVAEAAETLEAVETIAVVETSFGVAGQGMPQTCAEVPCLSTHFTCVEPELDGDSQSLPQWLHPSLAQRWRETEDPLSGDHSPRESHRNKFQEIVKSIVASESGRSPRRTELEEVQDAA